MDHWQGSNFWEKSVLPQQVGLDEWPGGVCHDPATHGRVRGGPLFRNWGNRDDQGIDPLNKPKILLMDVSVVSVVAEAWHGMVTSEMLMPP